MNLFILLYNRANEAHVILHTQTSSILFRRCIGIQAINPPEFKIFAPLSIVNQSLRQRLLKRDSELRPLVGVGIIAARRVDDDDPHGNLDVVGEMAVRDGPSEPEVGPGDVGVSVVCD